MQHFSQIVPRVCTLVLFIGYVLIFLFFYSSVGLMSDMWIGEKTVRYWRLPRRPVGASEVQEMACGHFQQKYDKVQAMIKTIGCMDKLLSGVLFNIYIQINIYITFLGIHL